jgi:hypothetical protein
MYCPTVQQIRDIVRIDSGGWTDTLDLLAHLKPSLTGTFMRYEVIDYSVSGHCCFEATVVDMETSCGAYSTICECFSKTVAEKVARALNAEEDAVDQDEVDRCATAALAGRPLTLNIPE